MNKNIANQIIAYNKNNYNSIALDFASTRNYIWPGVKEIVEDYINTMENKRDFPTPRTSSVEMTEGGIAMSPLRAPRNDRRLRVLDIGCGNGKMASIFRGENVEYIGIDNSTKLISEANKNFQFSIFNFQFMQGDILDLPDDLGKFDLILCLAVLHHIPSDELRVRALRNLKNALADKGTLIMTNWNLWNKENNKNVWKWNWEKFKMRDKEFKKNFGFQKKDLGFKDIMTEWKATTRYAVTPARYQLLAIYLYYYAFTKKEIKKLLRKAGFGVKENGLDENKKNIISMAN